MALTLADFDLHIKHVLGKQMIILNILSRKDSVDVNKTEDESKAHQNHAQGNGVTDIEEVVKLDADHAEF